MLDTNIKKQLTSYFQKLSSRITLRYAAGEHEKKAELLAMLEDVAALSENIHLEESRNPEERSLSFAVLAETDETGIRFSGIPGGHEFSSFVLALLQAGGSPVKLDDGVQKRIGSLNNRLEFQTIVSLSCHNCPDVVQTLNSISLLNKNISHEMVDGGVFPELVEERGVQGVPAVFLNGKPFANGKIDAGTIIARLLEEVSEDEPSEVEGDGTVTEVDVAIIGGGPAGVASAIYTARKGLKTMIIADRLGGQVKDTMAIENLISVRETTGPALAGNLTEHLGAYEVSVREHLRVQEIKDGERKTLQLNSGETVSAKTIIIATGARWRELGVPGEKENIGQGVAYCPHCDGPFFKGKDVAVIGGGNSGIEAALDLSGIVKSVKVMEFSEEFKADQVLLERAASTANIQMIPSAATKEILSSDGKVKGLSYEDRESGQERKLDLDGVFVQIGLVPNSAFLSGLVETNKMGEIMVDEKCRTNVPGIFACGDVTNTPYKQIIIAMGEGAKASLSAFEYLLKQPVAVPAA